MEIKEFLEKSLNKVVLENVTDQTVEEYRPLLGAWLIEMALMLNWYSSERSRYLPEIFEDNDFTSLTGLPMLDDDSPRERSRLTAVKSRKILTGRLRSIRKETLSPDLPLFANLKLLSDILGLTDADQVLLTFTASIQAFPRFRNAISKRNLATSNQMFCRILAKLSDIPESEFRLSIRGDGQLITTGLVKLDQGIPDLENKIDMIDGLEGILLTPNVDAEEIVGRFLKRAAPPTLELGNFPHLAGDSEILRQYLSNALEERCAGVNVLLYGAPGVGKTRYVQALAAELNVDLYEIAFSGENGEPIKGERRLRAYNLCQRLLCRKNNTLLMFDEIEDVFPSSLGFFNFLFGEDGANSTGHTGGKAWINRTLERNPVPTIWVSNSVIHIDTAYRRRFDYSVNFPIPPHLVRLAIAHHHLGCFNPPRSWLERIAVNDELSPAQLETAAKVARIASGGDHTKALQLVEQTLERSVSLLGQKPLPAKRDRSISYDLSYLATDSDIPRLIAGLRRNPCGTFCFYGPPGTGKSELARHIAREIGKPAMLRRASDILGMYVGESEKNIAEMFDRARQQDAVLILDEADSFLADRRDAQRSWEVTQVNELLTQMEAFDGVFICTTNLMEKLDPASLRRFAFKIRFDTMAPEQSWSMFREQLQRLGGNEADAAEWEPLVRHLDRLTPGDFAVAMRQLELLNVEVTPDALYDLLRKECMAKGGVSHTIGFSGVRKLQGRVGHG